MSFFIRGALVEYGSNFMGPIPNIVIFQFNPEQMARSFSIPGSGRNTDSVENTCQIESDQTSASPTESFPLTLYFSAADDLGENNIVSVIPRLFGIGPQLAALEKMIYSPGGIVNCSTLASLSAISDALPGSVQPATRNAPRQQIPRILFIWGTARVLPVVITSLSITEQKFDPLLNPVQAQVEVGLQIKSFTGNNADIGDAIGKGALKYTQTVKDVQAVLNLAKVAETAIDIIPF